MYCIECGTKIQSSAKFCPQCGTKQIIENHFKGTDSETEKIEKESTKPPISIERNTGLNKEVRAQKLEQFEILDNSTNVTLGTARKEKEAMYFGLIVIGVWLIIVLAINGELINLNESAKNLTIVSGVIRLISVLWIRGIAHRLDRDKLFWSIFAFFFPAIALIIIGNLTTKLVLHSASTSDITYQRDGYTFKMGSFRKFTVKLSSGKSYDIYQKKSNGKYFIYFNNEIFVFPNLETCIKFIDDDAR